MNVARRRLWGRLASVSLLLLAGRIVYYFVQRERKEENLDQQPFEVKERTDASGAHANLLVRDGVDVEEIVKVPGTFEKRYSKGKRKGGD